MKKPKIMLMAIAILAIVSGSLAFNAYKFQLHTFFTCTSIQGVTIGGNQAYGCTLQILTFYTTLNPTIVVGNLGTTSQTIFTTVPCDIKTYCTVAVRETQ